MTTPRWPGRDSHHDLDPAAVPGEPGADRGHGAVAGHLTGIALFVRIAFTAQLEARRVGAPGPAAPDQPKSLEHIEPDSPAEPDSSHRRAILPQAQLEEVLSRPRTWGNASRL
jgi:hypothetical protein